MKKRNIPMAFFCILLIFSQIGCSIQRDDVYSQNKAYLQYSLGEHDTTKEKISLSQSGIVISTYQWALRYKDAYGIKRDFIFNGTQSLGQQVVAYAENLAQDELQSSCVAPYYSNDGNAGIESIQVQSTLSTPKRELNAYDQALVHPSTGLKISGITAKELYTKWGVTFRVRIHYDVANGDIESIKIISERIADKMMAELETDDLELFVQGNSSNNSYILSWDKVSNAFEWKTEGDILDEKNLHDGRLTVVRNIYVDGQLIEDVNVTWDDFTKEYYINSGYTTVVLRALGIEYTYTGAQTFEWDIGSDHFILSDKENSITQNGVLLNARDAGSLVSTGMRLSVFETITGTVATYDKNAFFLIPKNMP